MWRSSSGSGSGAAALGNGTSAMRALHFAGLARHRLVVRAGGRVGTCRLRSALAFGAALLFDADFLVQRVLQLVGRALELVQALPERAAELGELPGPEN